MNERIRALSVFKRSKTNNIVKATVKAYILLMMPITITLSFLEYFSIIPFLIHIAMILISGLVITLTFMYYGTKILIMIKSSQGDNVVHQRVRISFINK
jgi:hypothetical protein